MILIISSQDDVSTNDVIHWMRYLKIDYIRVSAYDNIEIKSLNYDNGEYDFKLSINGNTIDSNSINSVWYRRSYFKLKQQPLDFEEDESVERVINKQMTEEIGTAEDFLLSLLEHKSLNSQRHLHINKPEVLAHCADLGIATPASLITTSKSEVLKFKRKHKEIITKNMAPGAFLQMEDFMLKANTVLVNDQILAEMPEKISISLFQEAINKSFEVRSFFLDGEFYSSAIFSQSDEQTKVDFRNYNFDKPNRTPPYHLPHDLRLSLTELMKRVSLNSGSIDLIVDETGKHIFLEVNPVGQFAQVSTPCNYNLEKKVALYLKNK